MGPAGLLFHLCLWAGVPAIAIAVATAVLAAINSIKAWIEFGRAARQGTVLAGTTFREWTTDRQRAVMRLLLQSLVAVTFSYMLAVVLNTGIRLVIVDPKNVFSLHQFKNTVGVAPWPRAAVWTVVGGIVAIVLLALAYMANLRGVQRLVKTAGVLVLIVVWIVFLWLGVAAVCMWLGVILDALPPKGTSGEPVPIPLAVTSTITAVLAGRADPCRSEDPYHEQGRVCASPGALTAEPRGNRGCGAPAVMIAHLAAESRSTTLGPRPASRQWVEARARGLRLHRHRRVQP